MIAAIWVLLSGLLVQTTPLTATPASPSSPSTSTSALDTPTDPAHAHAPEKRLLKYFLPSTNSWVGASIDGNKRGYGKNYLRFGRSDDDKRGGRNFLRFGRGDTTDYDVVSEGDANELEKRNRNFLRFGRGPNNFLRFGRAGVDAAPLAYARGLEREPEDEIASTDPIDEEKRGRSLNYLRFGRGGSNNFLRFGRTDSRNFLRFGRSVDRQLACENCGQETMGEKGDTSSSSSPSFPASRPKRSGAMASAQKHEENHTQRTKRSAYLEYASSPISWARTVQPDEEEELEEIDPQVGGEPVPLKRGYSRDFQRFERNRNFLRFGKRDGGDTSSSESSEPVLIVSPAEYPRYIRGSQNFLRFG